MFTEIDGGGLLAADLDRTRSLQEARADRGEGDRDERGGNQDLGQRETAIVAGVVQRPHGDVSRSDTLPHETRGNGQEMCQGSGPFPGGLISTN